MTPFYDLASIHHDLPLQNSMIMFVLSKIEFSSNSESCYPHNCSKKLEREEEIWILL